ncbi:MAG: N-acetylmuramoyl-L-alanine amidase [Bacteroidetes bacterium]|nr:N-acetylmuramoyl-L-alanine amidase [Bacteroidota bacterium]
MYKNINVIFLIIFIFLFNFHTDTNAQIQNKRMIIVIDAGHGGKDSGAIGRKSQEKNIVLAIALKLGKLIEDGLKDIKVIYTRKTDVFIELNKRAEIANKSKADLFISIHANSNKKTKPYGAETYVMGLHKTQENLDVAKRENSVIVFEEDYSKKYEGYNPNSSESYIIFSLMQNAYLEQSLSLASFVQGEIKNNAKRNDRGVKQAGFLVLWNTTMPSVLIETGFISNKKEEEYLISKKGENDIALCIYNALFEYIKSIKNKTAKELTNFNFNKTTETDRAEIKKDFTNDKIYFKIQIFSSSKQIPLNSNDFKGYKSVEEHKISSTFKYTVGSNENLKKIKKMQQSVKLNFPDAFIVAFKNGKKISINEAIKK